MSDIRQQALDYHAQPVPGKITIALTKPAETAHDLALAYSPGVAEPVREIANTSDDVYKYTGKGTRASTPMNHTPSRLIMRTPRAAAHQRGVACSGHSPTGTGRGIGESHVPWRC